MPEMYFLVRCEDAADGKYYSKIGRSLVHYILCVLLVIFTHLYRSTIVQMPLVMVSFA
jgi:hypothetical protein